MDMRNNERHNVLLTRERLLANQKRVRFCMYGGGGN